MDIAGCDIFVVDFVFEQTEKYVTIASKKSVRRSKDGKNGRDWVSGFW